MPMGATHQAQTAVGHSNLSRMARGESAAIVCVSASYLFRFWSSRYTSILLFWAMRDEDQGGKTHRGTSGGHVSLTCQIQRQCK